VGKAFCPGGPCETTTLETHSQGRGRGGLGGKWGYVFLGAAGGATVTGGGADVVCWFFRTRVLVFCLVVGCLYCSFLLFRVGGPPFVCVGARNWGGAPGGPSPPPSSPPKKNFFAGGGFFTNGGEKGGVRGGNPKKKELQGPGFFFKNKNSHKETGGGERGCGGVLTGFFIFSAGGGNRPPPQGGGRNDPTPSLGGFLLDVISGSLFSGPKCFLKQPGPGGANRGGGWGDTKRSGSCVGGFCCGAVEGGVFGAGLFFFLPGGPEKQNQKQQQHKKTTQNSCLCFLL